MRKIMVTGAAGFIGSHFVEDVIDSYKVVALCSMRSSGSLKRLEHLKDHPNLTVIYHDISCEFSKQLKEQIGEVNHVVHMGANPHVDVSVSNPREHVMSNVVGTLNVLEFAREYMTDEFIYFSTDEVFGPAGPDDYFDEYARYNSTSPYSATKAGGEELATSYFYSYDMPMIITHCMNVFGERQQAAALIPIVIRKVLAGEKFQVHTDKTETLIPSRHYMYVKDVTKGIRMLIDRPPVRMSKPHKFNLGKHDEVDVLTIAKCIAEILGKELDYDLIAGVRPFVDSRYSLNCSRMESLGWKADTEFFSKLKEVVEWFENNPEWLK